jgi:hypothetical protein
MFTESLLKHLVTESTEMRCSSQIKLNTHMYKLRIGNFQVTANNTVISFTGIQRCTITANQVVFLKIATVFCH